MTEELKPVRCGCGGEATVRTYGEPETPYCIQCVRCGITTLGYETEAEAIEAWNKAMGERTTKVEILEMKNTHNKVWKCSNCGQYMHRANWSREVKYCSHCGARLEWE